VGDGVFRLRLVIENSGWLPTQVRQKALDRKAAPPIEVELDLPEGPRVVTGLEREEVGQLAGRVERRAITWWNVDHSTSDRTKVEWVIEAWRARRGRGAPRPCRHRPSRARPLTSGGQVLSGQGRDPPSYNL